MQHLLPALPGVAIKVSNEFTGWIEPEADGYIGELPSGQILVRLEITDPERAPLYVFSPQMHREPEDMAQVFDQKILKPKRDLSKNNPMIRFPRFEMKTGIARSEQYKCPVVYYPQNHMVLIEVTGPGSFTLWEVGIISQAGKFFLIQQAKYMEQCYRYDDKVTCPAFEGQERKWPSLVDVLTNIFKDKLESLPSQYENYSSNLRRWKEIVIPEDGGQVIYFDALKHGGVGLIELKDGFAGIVWDEVKTKQRLKSLTSGVRVKIENLDPIPPEQRRYSYQYYAQGVAPLE